MGWRGHLFGWSKVVGCLETFSDNIEMSVMFLKFSIGMEDSIREIELSDDNDVIDTLKELSIAARKKKSNGMSDEYEY